MKISPDHALYLYGFTRSDLALGGPGRRAVRSGGSSPAPDRPFQNATGIDERYPPFVRVRGLLAAILSVVSRDVFNGPTADSRLEDLAWLGPRIHRQQAVLERALRLAPVLPARFGTLFSSLTAVDRFLEDHRATIADFLERVSGQEEWGVKGLLDRARAEEVLSREIQTSQGRPGGTSPGLAYLQAEKWRLKAREQLGRRVAAVCQTLIEALTPLAAETTARRVSFRPPTSPEQEVILSWAFLIAPPAAPEFKRRVEQTPAARSLPGLTFTVSGPWPPFSFCPALEAEPLMSDQHPG